MSKKFGMLAITLVFIALASAPLLAQGVPGTPESKAPLFKVALIVGGAVISLAVIAGAFCQARPSAAPAKASPGTRPLRPPSGSC